MPKDFHMPVSLVKGGLCVAMLVLASAAADAADSFTDEIAPLFIRRCLECHSGPSPEGGLRLNDAAGLMAGGESGPAVIPSAPEDSLLWQRVTSDEMPPEHPLPPEEKEQLARWIADGGRWQGGPLDLFAVTTDSRAGRDWWSLQPLRSVSPPTTASAVSGIDAFVHARLREADLRPAEPADPRTLVRRLFFDLIGLPPTPEQIDTFAASPTDEAYLAMVDELLASPAYGERWGRHWLDVVRYGESDGFERNFQREHAWPYRDWVIKAFNDDLPYDEFVRQQLIGDQLDSGLAGAAAVGFWVAGVHNTVVGGSERMKKLARQDEIEEVLATVGQTFVGLTFHCSRCHDHKFDPITQREYYQLASAISGLGHGERTMELPQEQAVLEDLDRQLASVRDQHAKLDAVARDRVLSRRDETPADRPAPPAAMARWEFEEDFRDSIGSLHGQPVGNARLEEGALILDGESFVETAAIDREIGEKTLEAWIQLDSLEQRGGGVISLETLDGVTFDAIVFGEREAGHWMAGSNTFTRSESFAGDPDAEADTRPVHLVIVYRADGTIECFRDGIPYGGPTKPGPLQPYHAGEADLLFGLRHRPGGGNRFLQGRLLQAALYDRALDVDEIARAAASGSDHVSETEIVAALSETERTQREQLRSQADQLQARRNDQAAKASVKLYTLSPGRGDTVQVLARGDPGLPGDVVAPGATAALSAVDADFALPPDADEALRRRKLAAWITHQDNPLFARVIVNRVWHHHFGIGLVDTPSDFGFNGGRPSHPDLLDHLASEFRRHGQSLKWLHREIVSSATYRQASDPAEIDPNGHRVDASNRLLWRGPVRRLEAEAIRDSMLAVAGVLEETTGGPGFKDVSITLNNGTTYYEPLDVDGPEFFRRTVYRFSPRGSRSALLESFDCPDPSATTPKRSVTTTPLQSLSLLNNAFVLRLSDRLAARVTADVGTEPGAQIEHAWRLTVGRGPTEAEETLSEKLIRGYGLAALCRGLFNTTEFVVIE